MRRNFIILQFIKLIKILIWGLFVCKDKILINSEYSAHDRWLSSQNIPKYFDEFIQILHKGRILIFTENIKRGRYEEKRKL